MIYHACAHLWDALNPVELENRAAVAAKVLKRFQYDAIAVRGASGLLYGAAVALATKKPLVVVRKPCERKGGMANGEAYTVYDVEYTCDLHRYVIVDDFISSGRTVRAIRDAIEKAAPSASCIGMISMNRMSEEYKRKRLTLPEEMW